MSSVWVFFTFKRQKLIWFFKSDCHLSFVWKFIHCEEIDGISNDANQKCDNEEEIPPLATAILYENVEIAKLLIKNGARFTHFSQRM